MTDDGDRERPRNGDRDRGESPEAVGSGTGADAGPGLGPRNGSGDGPEEGPGSDAGRFELDLDLDLDVESDAGEGTDATNGGDDGDGDGDGDDGGRSVAHTGPGEFSPDSGPGPGLRPESGPDGNADGIEDTDGEAFDRLTEFIEEELDFATSHYNDSYLERRFAARMRRLGLTDYEEYRSVLADRRGERRELLDALSINVTGFFRNEDVWDGIRDLLRSLSADADAVSVWSAGCADGREPYSVAMLARADAGIDADVSVLATDINATALDRARRGLYHSSRTVDIDDQLSYLPGYERFVDRTGDRFRVARSVREDVTFEHHDLINDPPKSGFDLVLCRNLFIYIDGEYKTPLLEAVREGIRPGGYLVIGKAETVPHGMREGLAVEDGPLRIYRRT